MFSYFSGIPYHSLSGDQDSLSEGPTQTLQNQNTTFNKRHRKSSGWQYKMVKRVNERNPLELLGAIPTSPFLSASGHDPVFAALKCEVFEKKIHLNLESDLWACRWIRVTLWRNVAPACKCTDLAWVFQGQRWFDAVPPRAQCNPTYLLTVSKQKCIKQLNALTQVLNYAGHWCSL